MSGSAAGPPAAGPRAAEPRAAGLRAQGTCLGSSARALSEVYDAALLDLDGVLYRGPDAVEHAAAAVAAARAAGMRLAFVTNNASRHPQDVAAHLTSLGVPTASGDVVTSAQAAVRLIASRLPPGAAVLVLGTDSLAQTAESAGLRPVRTVDQAGPTGVAAVLQGLAPETSLADLWEATVALRAGALWVAGNTDASVPTPRGALPGNGAFVRLLADMTGREPLVAGKPDPELHRESVERVGALRPLVVGDRLDTDVLGAVRGGADSLLVLTGVTDRTALLQAPAGSRPTYVSSDLRGILHSHPEVEVDMPAGLASCRRAVVHLVDGRLRWDGVGSSRAAGKEAYEPSDAVSDGTADDALRAEVALAWAFTDGGGVLRHG